jgi:histidinol-phosphatase
MDTVDSDLDLANRLADTADAIGLRHFTEGVGTAWRAKSDGSPVSAADEQIEVALRTRILRERPGDAVLGEEFGAVGTGRRRWIVDPVDGTASFLAGEPEWSTLIALQDDGHVTLGLVTAPALARRWWAGHGRGAWTRSIADPTPAAAERLTISGARTLTEASIGIWPPPARLRPENAAIAARVAAAAHATLPAVNWTDPTPPRTTVRKPSTGTGTCHGGLMVATGRLDAFLFLGAGTWDVAPLIPIIEEAGGSYDDLTSAAETRTASALFANHALRQEILEVVKHGS